MRLFVALTLPAAVQDRLYRETALLRDAALPVRWVAPESLHLTLKFLGEVRPDDVVRVQAATAVAAARTRPLDLRIGGLGAFPSVRRPRAVWIGVEATPALRCLKQDLEWELSPLGFERETQSFQPHVTLGRARAEAPAGAFRSFETLIGRIEFGAEVRVSEVDLLRSHPLPAGPRYERIAAVPLGVATTGPGSTRLGA